MLTRVGGWLLGAALGDALGAPHEFKTSKAKYTGKLEHQVLVTSRFQGTRYGVVGQTTDDTEMTLILANHIATTGKYVPETIVLEYMKWANSCSTLGRNTRALLSGVKTIKGYQGRFDKQFPDHKAKMAAQSNGALMRCGSLALLYDNFAVANDCMLTNPSTVAVDTNLVYTAALRYLIEGSEAKDVVAKIVTLAQTDEVKQVLDQAIKGEKRDLGSNKGWCLHGLYAAIYVILRYTSFTDAMSWIMSHPRSDTDTNACIAGGLLGAAIGYETMLKDQLTAYNVGILFNVNTTTGDFPRDEQYILRNASWIKLTESLTKLAMSRQEALNKKA